MKAPVLTDEDRQRIDRQQEGPIAGASIQRFHVAGLGASAGGLEALREFFAAVPADSGIAYVVQQHLSPDFESHMVQLLARSTVLPVSAASDGLRIQPNHVYIAPPRKEMIFSNGTLLLTDKDLSETFSLPIDHFFRSLALSAGERAIAIVLSGTGSDGTRGLRAVHEAGGLTVCQRPNTARFDGMLKNALGTGLVDLTLPPDQMGSALARFAAGQPLQPPEEDDASLQEQGAEQRLFEVLRRSHGIDFSHYKPTTITRRLERRVQLAGKQTMEEYLEQLQQDPEELDALYRDLLIGVTRFFRDAETFELLRTDVLPSLLASAAARSGEFRAWIAGCATGEEAYTLAMVIDEALERSDLDADSLSIRIFATDVHRRSVEFASQGRYPEAALDSMSEARRERYFDPCEDGRYQVVKELRERVVFATHDLVGDAPFTKVDLVSCRNLLIYFQPGAQRKSLLLFHFALRAEGCLLLGSSETPGSLQDEFEQVQPRHKLYRKRRDIRLPIESPTSLGQTRHRLSRAEMPAAERLPVARAPNATADTSEMLALYDQLLKEHMPPALLVDEAYRLLHVFGDAARLLSLNAGRVSTSVLDLLHPALRTAAASALQRCESTAEPIRYAGISSPDLEGQSFIVSAKRIQRSRGLPPAFLLRCERAVEDAGAGPEATGSSLEILEAAEASRDYIRGLEADLQFSRENLQATIEELETSNEELQATNEELVASNEELQSTNEELNSVNEELNSVNTEHQIKIGELTVLTDEMNSLLAGCDLGILFVDRELAIKRFTPPMGNLLHLRDRDEGRKLSDFARNLSDTDVIEDVQQVLTGKGPVEREVRDGSGKYHLLRVLPHPRSNDVRGALLTLVDIDQLKRTDVQMRQLSAIAEHASDAILAKTDSGLITAWNRGAERLYGYPASEAVGRQASFIVPDELLEEHEKIMEDVARGGAVEQLETRRKRRDGSLVEVALSVSPVRDEDGRLVGFSSIARDITLSKLHEAELRQEDEYRDRFLAMLSHELRNPLMGLMTASESLSETEDAHEAELAAAVVHRQTQHMASLLRDLFDVSRIRQGKFQVTEDTMDLRDALDGPLDVARARGERDDVRIEVSSAARPVYVKGDLTRVRQVVTNLLDNAIEHSPAGGRVELSLEAVGSEARLSVSDDGAGMDEATCQRIFDPFFQHKSDGRGGLGLGLSIVRSVARAHGGDVTVHSDGPGAGSRFVVTLPLSAAPAHHARSTRRDSGEPLTILLVEDNDDNRELTQLAFSRRGYRVRTADSVAAARATLDQAAPDALVVDLGLPDGTGHDVARYARKLYPQSPPLLIALTGHSQPSDREASGAAGFDHHLVKPTPAREVCRVVDAHFQ